MQTDGQNEVQKLLLLSDNHSMTVTNSMTRIQVMLQQKTQTQTQFRVTKAKSQFVLSPQAQNLFQAKEEKRQAEQNLLALQTRVQLLKLQDQKNQKQIKQTKQKTFSLIQSKTRSYLDKQLLQYHYQKMQQTNEDRADEIRQKRKREQMGIEDRKAFLLQKRDKEINFQHELKAQTLNALQVRQQKDDMDNLSLYNTIKDHEWRLDIKKKTIEGLKLRVTEQNYKDKVETQLREALNTQMQLEMMEQQEQLAIKQLQSTQDMKRGAIQDIKSLIQSPQSRQNVKHIYNL